MKRLLIAPLLLGLVISNSVLAGRPNPKKEAEDKKQEEYISLCNQNNWKNACNKVSKSNRNRITNKDFLDLKVQNERDILNRCTQDKIIDACHNLYFMGRYKKFEWIELSESDILLIKEGDKAWSDELSKEVEKIRRKKEEQKNMPTNIELLRKCEYVIKAFLKDPNSYKRINTRYMQEATGIIEYTATNSFGGRVRESYKCFNP